jgi:hypothetical protein
MRGENKSLHIGQRDRDLAARQGRHELYLETKGHWRLARIKPVSVC